LQGRCPTFRFTHYTTPIYEKSNNPSTLLQDGLLMQRANWVADVSHVKACVTDAIQSLPTCFVRCRLKSVPPQARYHNPAGRPSGSSYRTNTASSVPNAPARSDPASSVRKTRIGGETVPHPSPLPEHTGSVRSPCCRNRQRKYPKWQRLCKRSDRRRRDNPGQSSCAKT